MVEWCSFIALHSVSTSIVITVLEKSVRVYIENEPMDFEMPNSTACDNLVLAFVEERSHLRFPDVGVAGAGQESIMISAVCNVM